MHMRTKQPTKVAVIGCGVLGSRHAELYRDMPHTELVGVMDIVPEKAKKLAIACRTEGYAKLEKLYEKLDAASICVPAVHHFSVSKKLLNQNIHLLIEKPITTRLDHADQILAIARKKNLVLQVGHIERFNSAVQHIKKIVKKPLFIECDRIGRFNPRVADVGVVLDLMIHDIDIMLYLVNSPVEDVASVGLHFHSKREDFVNCRLLFKNKTIGNITASRMAKDPLRKIRIFQNNTYISLDYMNQEALISRRQTGGNVQYQRIPIEKSHALKAELQSFIDCVRKGKRPLVSGEDGRRALAVALRILDQIRGN